ncbi:hypothetical protein [Bradyrhizobium uaiense]|nr:hypothetical protein [Bradyrhizobium uaiense]
MSGKRRYFGAIRPVPGADGPAGGLNSGGFATYIAGPINKEKEVI